MKSDAEIREHVVEELLWDPQLTNVAPGIGVAVTNEVVTLSGTVDNYYQKVAAERAAQRVAGVKVVAMDIDVKGSGVPDSKTDTAIAEAVRNALTWHSAVNEDLINIKVDNGRVYLDGAVHWDYERKAAEKAVENIKGVKSVINRVTIRTRVMDPVEVKRQISAAFHRQASIDSSSIVVDIIGSTVKLSGVVRTFAEKVAAQRVAVSMPGITDVDNRLEINSAVFAD